MIPTPNANGATLSSGVFNSTTSRCHSSGVGYDGAQTLPGKKTLTEVRGNCINRYDTTTFKPLASDGSGNVNRLDRWPGSGGFTNPMTTTGDIIYSSSGTTASRLGIGLTGQVLPVAGGVPTWDYPNLLVSSAGTSGSAIWHTSGDTLKLSKLIGGSGISITKGSDSSITIAASGGTGWSQDGSTVGSEKWLGTIDNYSLPIRTNNIERARYNTSGQYLFNTTTTTLGGLAYGYTINDTTYSKALRLGGTWPVAGGGAVNNGILMIHGGGTGSSTYSQVNYDNGANIRFMVRDDGQITVNNTVFSTSSMRTGSGNYFFQPSNSASITGYLHGWLVSNNLTLTSGNVDYHQISYSFMPTSGTGTHSVIHNKITVNQTGGANGRVRFIYDEPTLTAAADYVFAEATQGRTILKSLRLILLIKHRPILQLLTTTQLRQMLHRQRFR